MYQVGHDVLVLLKPLCQKPLCTLSDLLLLLLLLTQCSQHGCRSLRSFSCDLGGDGYVTNQNRTRELPLSLARKAALCW